MEVTIGGNRLGSGNKNKVWMREYERSTHDLSFVWRSTLAPGTLVPFLTEVALPGDTFDVDLNADVMTHPTIGPLFGTKKLQLDVYQIPVRLYQRELHMNKIGIGMDMSKVKLPLINMVAEHPDPQKPIDNQQINPSCIFSYLNIRGLGYCNALPKTQLVRQFNAITYLGYWDIYKNYYANKQEEIGAVIHKNLAAEVVTLNAANIKNSIPEIAVPVIGPPVYAETDIIQASSIVIDADGLTTGFDPSQLIFWIEIVGAARMVQATSLWQNWEVNLQTGQILGTNPTLQAKSVVIKFGQVAYDGTNIPEIDSEPTIVTFPLKNIDDMRTTLLTDPPDGIAYQISNITPAPYGLALQNVGTDYCKQFAQEGLALKTYNSDLFNNWISTEWIDGVDGISAVTAVDTSGGSFTIDEINLAKKIYDMLNRIAISGGSYDDWLDAVYTHERRKSIENPVYLGGLIKQIVFQEVISNTAAAEQPLGTLAGRGVLGSKHKGGKITVKIDEPSYLLGIVSITPNIDYSQGNKWDTGIFTMNDFHKPALDEIGFQDLITDQMAWFDTSQDDANTITFKSAGKQPAWINYMTNVNIVRGNFADQSQQMFMTLNRRYSTEYDGVTGNFGISDLTTYIDPVKFNHIFADTRRDAQNFWVQIGVQMEVRRKMSAKVIPNL